MPLSKQLADTFGERHQRGLPLPGRRNALAIILTVYRGRQESVHFAGFLVHSLTCDLSGIINPVGKSEVFAQVPDVPTACPRSFIAIAIPTVSPGSGGSFWI